MAMMFHIPCASAHLRFYAIAIVGILYCVLGSAGIVLSVTELFHGRPSVAHYNTTEGGLQVENPLWPSTGKGFWIGLLLIATGLIGVLASRERTPPAVTAFTCMAAVSTVLSFYLVITSIVPVQYAAKYSEDTRPSWQLVELIVNALLIAVGCAACILGGITTLYGMIAVGCCASQRRERAYSDADVARFNIVPEEFMQYGV